MELTGRATYEKKHVGHWSWVLVASKLLDYSVLTRRLLPFPDEFNLRRESEVGRGQGYNVVLTSSPRVRK